MKIKSILFIAMVVLNFVGYSTNKLTITNPQSTWLKYSASIKEALLEITPKGGFVENSLYLSIGVTEPFSQENLQLEIVLNFELPANSIVTDSWLWIEGVPKQAEILDRWTASNIYEQIVSRRKDPSLLVKNGSNQYSINIYPLKPNETRKFKITYLTPIDIKGNTITCSYPSGILATSAKSVSELTVYAHPNGTYIQPAVINGTTTFEPFESSEFGNCFRAQIVNADFEKAKILFMDTNTNPVKFYRYGSENEGFYQLSFLPSACLDQEKTSQKVCYLIDYNQSFYKGIKSQLTNLLATNLTGSYTEKDSFNVIFSNLAIEQAFEKWKPVTDTNLTEAFKGKVLSDYSNLIQLLAKGINFINNNGGTGKIVLLTNNSFFDGVEKTNQIIKDINNLNANKVQIDIIDYTDNYYTSSWVGNTRYWGNSYLLSNIARTNSGEYIHFLNNISNNTFSNLMVSALNDVSAERLSKIDIYTDAVNGFCYGRMNFTSENFTAFKMNKVIHQIGKYKGNPPYTVEITGEVNSNLIYNEFELKASDISEIDSSLRKIWLGRDIQRLEKETQSAQVITEIVFQSIENRILSLYTAFLCLEDSISICTDCTENQQITGLSQIGNEEIKAYPNPFRNFVKIQIKPSDKLQKLEIYNMMGQLVKVLKTENHTNEFIWDGTAESGNTVPAGIYLLVVKYTDKTLTLKIQKST